MLWRNRKSILRLGLFLLSIFAVTSFGFIRVTAESIPFVITNVEVTEMSPTATGGVTDYDNNIVHNNIVFHRLGDSVTYKITIKNNSDTSRVVENVDSSYQGELFDFSFNNFASDEIQPGESFDFVLKTSYVKSVSDAGKRNQDLTIEFVFKFTDGSQMSFTIANPSTWDNISVFGVILALSVIGLLILIIFHMKHWSNDKKVIVTAVLLAFACLPLPFVNAVAGEYGVAIKEGITLRDIVIVDYYNEGDEQIASDALGYGEMAADVAMPTKKGYNFDGWQLKNGELFDFNTPVEDDLVLYARYTPIEYSVQFNGNGAENTMASQQFTYDEAANLRRNELVRAGYDFIGWNSTVDGSGNDYSDGGAIENLRDEPGVYNLFAIWRAKKDTPYTVVDKFMTVDGKGYDYITRPAAITVGTTDSEVTPAPFVVDGFMTPDAQTKTITGDGQMKIEYEYVREQRRLTIKDSQFVESSHASGLHYYGTRVTLKAKKREGLKLDKWSNGDTDEVITITLDNDVTVGPEYVESEFPIVYSHDGACTFNGIKSSASGTHGAREADDITGEECADYAGQKYIDTGVKLYDADNAHKDFYIEFTINEFDLAKNGERATFLNVTQERAANAYPGIVVRRYDGKTGLMIGANVVVNKSKVLNYKNDVGDISSIQRVRFVRKNDALCYAINDGDYEYIGDNTPHNQYFEVPTVMFGATYNEDVAGGKYERYLNGTLSGMKIRLGKDVDDEINCSGD